MNNIRPNLAQGLRPHGLVAHCTGPAERLRGLGSWPCHTAKPAESAHANRRGAEVVIPPCGLTMRMREARGVSEQGFDGRGSPAREVDSEVAKVASGGGIPTMEPVEVAWWRIDEVVGTLRQPGVDKGKAEALRARLSLARRSQRRTAS
jgi:hypothetical protein